MLSQEASWGGRVALLDPAHLDPEQRGFYDKVAAAFAKTSGPDAPKTETSDGRLIGPFNAMLFSPALATSFLDLQKKEEEVTPLSKRARQVVILSVGSVWESAYALYAHAAAARAAGFSPEAVQALKEGREHDELSSDERTAQRVALQVVAKRRVTPSLFKEAQAAFGDEGIVDVLVLIACYQTVCSVLNVFEVPAPT